MTGKQGVSSLARIDLNSDLGENFGAWRLGDDAAMLEVVTSANVACGFHAGDPSSIRETLERAAGARVSVGAHVAYPDLVGFGRRKMDIDAADLEADVAYQIGALQGMAALAGTSVRYVKPHGALYNTIAGGGSQAEAVVNAILRLTPKLPLVGLAGSPLITLARDAGIAVVSEAFADRAYAPDASLVPRSEPKAVIQDPELIAARMVRLAREGVIEAIDGRDIELCADSICVHGDGPGSLAIARSVRRALEGAGVQVLAFTGASGHEHR